MITKQNFKDLLKHLDFSENNHIFSKNIDGSELKVDFDNEKLASDNKVLSFEVVQAENGSKSDYFRVWSDTYQQDFFWVTNGVRQKAMRASNI